MREYIVSEDSYAYEMRRYDELKELIRCKECAGYDEGRCHWWYDDPDVPEDGYCFQAEREEDGQDNT